MKEKDIIYMLNSGDVVRRTISGILNESSEPNLPRTIEWSPKPAKQTPGGAPGVDTATLKLDSIFPIISISKISKL